jgi:hypothetical protein
MSNFSTLTLSIPAAAAVLANRGITATGAVPAAGGNVIGFTRTEGAVGDLVPTDAAGTVLATAGAAIANGAALEVDAQGRVVTRTSGATVGRALKAATGAGDVIEIRFIPN